MVETCLRSFAYNMFRTEVSVDCGVGVPRSLFETISDETALSGVVVFVVSGTIAPGCLCATMSEYRTS